MDVSTSGSSTMFQHLPIPQIESLQQKLLHNFIAMKSFDVNFTESSNKK
jgi:hypothetical protein